jgi:hypothetical protein
MELLDHNEDKENEKEESLTQRHSKSPHGEFHVKRLKR